VELFLDRIRSAIARHPDRQAFVGRDGGATFRDTRALIGATMRGLDAAGVKPGHVVALGMPQSPVHLIAMLALARLGAVTLPLPWTADEAERAAIARAFGARIVVSGHERGGVAGLPLVVAREISARGDEGDFDTWPFVPVPGTPMRIALTSGTVGERKGIDHDHGMFSRRLARGSYGGHPEPRVIPPRLHITAALQASLHALCHGGAVAFPAGYETPQILEAAANLHVTHLLIPPAHIAAWLSLVPGDRPALPAVSQLRLVGGSASLALVAEIRRKLTRNIHLGYSTTETGILASGTPELLEAHPGCAGRLHADARVEALDEQGSPLPPGATGELRARVEGMATAYHGGVHAERYRDGWFYPHDRGRVTADGIVYVEGRTDFVINVGGRKVSPEHIERCLEEDPAVAEAAVFAIDGEDGFTRAAAAIVPRAALDWAALARHAQSRLDVLAPSRYYEVESLPRNAMGKLERAGFARLASSPLRHSA
jgi:acyl-coenzyme A synthetase/AMP-(fatty) acid ligase